MLRFLILVRYIKLFSIILFLYSAKCVCEEVKSSKNKIFKSNYCGFEVSLPANAYIGVTYDTDLPVEEVDSVGISFPDKQNNQSEINNPSESFLNIDCMGDGTANKFLEDVNSLVDRRKSAYLAGRIIIVDEKPGRIAHLFEEVKFPPAYLISHIYF